jgi:hypothetical protein
VLLPAPEGPTIATVSPAATARSSPSITVSARSPLPYDCGAAGFDQRSHYSYLSAGMGSSREAFQAG